MEPMSCALPLVVVDELPSGELAADEAAVLEAKLSGAGVKDIAALQQLTVGEVVAILGRPAVARERAARLAEQRVDIIVGVEAGLNRAVMLLCEALNGVAPTLGEITQITKSLCDIKKLGLEQERLGYEMSKQLEARRQRALSRALLQADCADTPEQAIVWDTQSRALISGATPVTVAVLNSPSINKGAATADGTPEGFFSSMNSEDKSEA